MKKKLSPKARLALKNFMLHFSQRLLEHETHYRIHLLHELTKVANAPKISPELLNIIFRQYPCDTIRKQPKSIITDTLREKVAAHDLDSLVNENELLSTENRAQLLDLYTDISASNQTFDETTAPLNLSLHSFEDYKTELTQKNYKLHKKLAALTIESEWFPITEIPPKPIPRELLRTQSIIDEQTEIGVRVQSRTASRCLTDAPNPRMDEIIPKIRIHIAQCVNESCPITTARCVTSEEKRLERAVLVGQAEHLNEQQLCDTTTLARSYDELDNQYQKLQEERNNLLSEISRLKRRQVSLDKVGISKQEEFNMSNIRLNEYRDIIGKNGAQLERITEENTVIRRRINQREAIERTGHVYHPTNEGKLVNAQEYKDCSGLTSITIDSSIEFIGASAFSYCTSLETVDFPSSLKTIKKTAFEHCYALKVIDLPIPIDTYAFQKTTSLEDLYLPSTLQQFGSFAIRYSGPNLVLHLAEPCGNFTCLNGKFLLTSDKMRTVAVTQLVTVSDLYTLPTETTIFGHESFGSSSLGPNVTFPDQIEVLEEQLFEGSHEMVNIEIGKGIRSIEGNTFNTCDKIEKYTVHPDNVHFTAIEGVLYNADKTRLIAFPHANKMTSLTLPATIEDFGMSPFYDNQKLAKFSFDNGQLDGTKYILDADQKAVYTPGYKELKRVVPVTGDDSACEKIGYGACTSCRFVRISFSENLTLVDSFAFYLSRISEFDFSHVYCKDNSFHGTRKITSVHIPGNWKTIEEATFYSSSGIETVVIDSGVTHIGPRAFSNAPISVKLTLPDTLEELQESCFAYCLFPELTLPTKCLKIVGPSAFESCTVITKIYIPACVAIVHNYAYSTCKGAKDAVFESCNTEWTPLSFYSIYDTVQPKCIATRFFSAHREVRRSEAIMPLFKLNAMIIAMMCEVVE